MTRLQFSMIAFAPVIICLDLLNSPVIAQIARPTAVVQSAAETALARPSLKVRQPTSEPDSSSVGARPSPISEQQSNPEISPNVIDQSKVRFEGLHAFPVGEVLKIFREQEVWVRKDQESHSRVLERASSVLREALVARGYMQARVEALQDEGTGPIVLWVLEGPRFSIGEIRFEGNRIFSSEELATRMRGLLQQYEESAKSYDAEIFDVCLRQLANFLRSQGYLQARFGEPKKEVTDARLVVTVPVEEGNLYRLGEIKIEGARNLNQERVRAMLSLQQGDIVSGEEIGKWLYEDLKKLYGEMGYIQYMAEPEPKFRVVDSAANEGVVDFKVTIEEGPQFKISSIRFKGSNISEKELNALLLIRPGDVFNQRLLEKSVEQMNETKRFEMIDIDKDTEFITDEEDALLEITFRIQRVKAH